jgi:hypothetical protein
MSTIIHEIKRTNGVAGLVAYDVTGTTDNEPFTLGFVGQRDGDPGVVVMIQASGAQVFVTSPGRFGPRFNAAWVRQFLAG